MAPPGLTELGDAIVVGRKASVLVAIVLDQKLPNNPIPGLVQFLIDATLKLPDSVIQAVKQRASQLGPGAVGVWLLGGRFHQASPCS